MTKSLPVFTSNRLTEMAQVSHGFFGRQGGISRGLYASLNAGHGSDDEAEAIATNRTRIASAIGAAGPEHLLSCYQTHSANVLTLTEAFTDRPEADAMVTAMPGLALCILTADCVPVLFADRKAGVIGAAHAGWKGALGGVCERTVEAMCALGAKPKNITAAIGPCISQDSYEVGPEFRDTILKDAPWSSNLFAPGKDDRSHFNLQTFVKNRLVRLKLGWIDVINHDTCALENQYFSNRRRNQRSEPDYGRNASVIMLSGTQLQ